MAPRFGLLALRIGLSGSKSSEYSAATELLKNYKKLPDTKEILAELDSLQEKKNTLMKEYSDSKTNIDDLFIIRKNFEQYMGKEMER